MESPVANESARSIKAILRKLNRGVPATGAFAPPGQAHLSKLKSRDWRKATRKAGFNRFSSLESSISQIHLPKGEGGPKGRVRGEVPGSSPLTRRFAAPSPFGRGIRPKHFSILDSSAYPVGAMAIAMVRIR